MKTKNDFVAGLETILNNKDASFLRNPKVFKEIHTQSGMPLTQMIKHLGRRTNSKKVSAPTDEERSKARMDAMEEASKK